MLFYVFALSFHHPDKQPYTEEHEHIARENIYTSTNNLFLGIFLGCRHRKAVYNNTHTQKENMTMI